MGKEVLPTMESVESVPKIRAGSRGKIARILKMNAGFMAAFLAISFLSIHMDKKPVDIESALIADGTREKIIFALGSIPRAKISLGMPEAEAAEIDKESVREAARNMRIAAQKELARLEAEEQKIRAEFAKKKAELEAQAGGEKLTPAEEAELRRIRAKRAALQREMAKIDEEIEKLREENAELDAENARIDKNLNRRNELLDFLKDVPVD